MTALSAPVALTTSAVDIRFIRPPEPAAEVVAVLERMTRATAAHDAIALGTCFATDFRSEQPAHPGRAFRGPEILVQHWAQIFSDIPDFRAETLRTAIDGATVWSEIRWSGNKRDGSMLDVRGAMVMEIADGKIAWARLYVEPVEQSSTGPSGTGGHEAN